jgi:hypothetical protein
VEFSRSGDGLSTTGNVEFAKDIIEMFFDRPDRDDQCPGNLLVRVAGGHKLQDFEFAGSQGLN